MPPMRRPSRSRGQIPGKSRKKDGRMLITAIWKLSKDGTTLSNDFTGYQPNGSTLNFYYVYKRTAGRSGFSGT
jgi:hypothetical protein